MGTAALGEATRDRGGGPQGLRGGGQPEDSVFPSREAEGRVIGGSRHLSTGLSPKRQPYLFRRSCTLFGPGLSRPTGATGPPGDRRPTGQPGRLPGLTGPARGLPAELCPGPGRGPAAGPAQPSAGLQYTARLQLFRMRGGGPEGAGPRLGLRSQEPAGKPGSSRTGGWETLWARLCVHQASICAHRYLNVFTFFEYVHLCGVRNVCICVNICNLWVFRRV